MTALIKRAEALEANATVAEHAAKSQHADAERWRAEAAKLREQAREPLRLWVNYGAGMPAYAYTSESDARHNASMARTRIAVPMAELARALEDAERYRWLRDASNLTLRTDGSTWTRADGNKFVSTHFLAVGDTQYGPCKSLDAAIDAARNSHD